MLCRSLHPGEGLIGQDRRTKEQLTLFNVDQMVVRIGLDASRNRYLAFTSEVKLELRARPATRFAQLKHLIDSREPS